MKLILTKTKNCISVYDEHLLDSIDFFPNDKSGRKEVLKYFADKLKPKKKRKK